MATPRATSRRCGQTVAQLAARVAVLEQAQPRRPVSEQDDVLLSHRAGINNRLAACSQRQT